MTLIEITNTIGNIAEAIGEARKDESPKGTKVSGMEGIKIASESLPLIKMLFSLRELKAEYFSLTDETRAEIVKIFSANFQIENQKARIIIQKIFSITLALEDVVQVLIEKE